MGVHNYDYGQPSVQVGDNNMRLVQYGSYDGDDYYGKKSSGAAISVMPRQSESRVPLMTCLMNDFLASRPCVCSNKLYNKLARGIW